MALFRRTRLAEFRNCLSLFEAYADLAPFWERTLLSAYVGIGPPVARVLGGNTKTVWRQAESILGDMFAVSGMSAHDLVRWLRHYIKIRRETDHYLPFDQACRQIYDQSFYPLVTHFTFAFQSSAVARLRFVRRVAAAMTFKAGTVADLGCGSGAMLCEVLHSNPTWIGFGLDISPASIDYARRLTAHRGLASRAHFQQGDIAQLPFADGSIDFLIASEVIEHLNSPAAVLREIVRVLAPGGFLALTVPVESHTPAHMNTLCADDFKALCENAGLQVKSLASTWHLTFGDDPRHLFVVAQQRSAETSPSPVRMPLQVGLVAAPDF
jgi:ubiquinone/menaquinone biosynthesis C-methylase UbiE